MNRVPARTSWLALATLCIPGLACSADGGGALPPVVTPTTAISDGSYARIQREILDVSCISCHRAGDANAKQSGLVLTADSSFLKLVGVASTQTSARADGMVRVRAFKADSSLLYHKLAWIPGHHGRDYGQLMPMGTVQGVTAGQLEYVRRWIEAGAPRTGHVVDSLVLRDNRVQAATFTPLPPPTVGVQLRVDSFAVTPSTERELFVYRNVANATDLYVTRIESRMCPGSHHLLLYTFDDSKTTFPCNARPVPDVPRDIRNNDGSYNIINMLPMACHIYFAGAMTPDFDYRFPPGVALRLSANARLDFNVHYVNRSPAALAGQAFANLHTVERSQVQTIAKTLNYANETIVLPPNQRTTISRAFTVSVRTTVLGLTSHMHARGEKFEIRLRRANGAEQTVYTNTDWEHPAFTNFASPLVLEPGDALVSVVTWNNTTSNTLRFGLASTDEMDIIFGYWY